MKVFSGSSNRPLAEKVAKNLNLKLSPLEIHTFPDGEKRIQLKESVVSQKVILVQSTNPPVNLNYMELFLIADTIKRNGASSLTLVCPYLGYQRQDHIFREGEGVTFKTMVKLIEAVGVDKIITFDLHTIKIPEFFKIKIVHLSALPLFAEVIRAGRLPTLQDDARLPQSENKKNSRSLSESRLSSSKQKQRKTGSVFNSLASGQSSSADHKPYANDYVLVSPDMGGIRRIKEVSEMLGNAPYASINKNRDLKTGKIELTEIEGDVRGKIAVLVDDMISTGKTIAKGAEFLKNEGAKSVFAFATHAVFSKNASEILQKAPIEKIYVTDSIDIPKQKKFPKLEILSIAKEIAEGIMKE